MGKVWRVLMGFWEGDSWEAPSGYALAMTLFVLFGNELNAHGKCVSQTTLRCAYCCGRGKGDHARWTNS